MKPTVKIEGLANLKREADKAAQKMVEKELKRQDESRPEEEIPSRGHRIKTAPAHKIISPQRKKKQ